MSKYTITRIAVFIVCFAASLNYIFMMYFNAEGYLSQYLYKPFVYRHLFLWLAELFPLEFGLAVTVVTSLFAIALIVLLMKIYETTWAVTLRNDMLFILSYAFFVIILIPYAKHYDIPSAFFFMFTIWLWSKDKIYQSLPVFLLACLNRESAIILVPLFAALFYKKFLLFSFKYIWSFLYILASSVLIRFAITRYFSLAETFDYNIVNPLLNVYSALLLVLLSVIAFLAVKNVSKYNRVLGVSITVLFPLLLIAHVVFGNALELRTFAEILPLLFMSFSLR